jgi:transcriptional regulator with XRE-family HTH domain
VSKLQKILHRIQVRVAVVKGRQLTQSDLAEVADVTPRSLGEWMRGTSAPKGMSAVFNLLAALPKDSVTEVLEEWRESDEERYQ